MDRLLQDDVKTIAAGAIFTRTSRFAGQLIGMKIYRGFPRRLDHTVPHWVEPGALFHIRMALDREKEQRALTDPAFAHVRHGESVLWRTIFDSAKFYETKVRWVITLFLLMPDHLHALLSFARNEPMSEFIRDWKRFHARMNHVICQEGYFDHRLRVEERGTQLSAKMDYIRQNPVAAGLCAKSEDWPWVSIHSHASIEVDRLLRRRC